MERISLIIGILLIVFLASFVKNVFNDKSTTTTLPFGELKSDKNLPSFPVTSAEDISILKSKVNKDLTYDIVLGSGDAYKGEIIEWGGRVFTEPDKDEKGVYLQIFATGDDKNFLVNYSDPSFEVKVDDYVIVTGVVKGVFEGENAFGAKLKAVKIEAGLIEKGSRSETVAPAGVKIPINQTDTQYKFSVTLERVELAKEETRFHFILKNDSDDAVRFYTYDTKLTQGSKQYESESIYNSDEKLPSEILPGVKAKGVIVFSSVDVESEDLKLFLDAPSSDNYSLNWKKINFVIPLNGEESIATESGKLN